MPSSTMNNNDRKRRGLALSNTKKIRRSELIKNSKNERQSQSSSIEDSLIKINDMKQEYSLSKDINSNKQDIVSNENSTINKQGEIEINTNLISSPIVLSPIITSSDLITKKSLRPDSNIIIQQTDGKTKLLKLVVPKSTNSSSSIKMLSNGDGLSSALRIPTKIQLTKTLSTQNDNLILTSINQEQVSDQHQIIPSSIMDITEKQQIVLDYPLTPPPVIKDQRKGIEEIILSIPNEHQIISKRYLTDWSVPPTSELSPTSLTSSSPDLSQNPLTSDDSFVELHLKNNLKRRYRSLSSSCPIIPYSVEKSTPIKPPYKSKSLSRISNFTNKRYRSLPTIIKYSSIQRLKKRRRDNQVFGKRFKLKTKNQYEFISTSKDILNEIIEQIETINTLDKPANSVHTDVQETEQKPDTEIEERMDEDDQKIIVRQAKISSSIENVPSSSNDLTDNSSINELNRQTSTPLSFHSIPSSTPDEQSIISPHSQSIVSKTHIFTDIVNELIKGAKGLDKLSCSLVNFTNSIHHFIRLTTDKQNEKVDNLQQDLEKKCSTQLTRANLFCSQKIQYFINKHSVLSMNEYLHEITLIVKYFYLYVLSLNCRKQENEFELILTDLINGKLDFINSSFYSSILTTIIEDFILTSSLANDYLMSQPILINQIEYSLPFIRNTEFENELLYKNDTCLTINPFSDQKDFEDYLNRCEHMLPTIPYYPTPQSSMYYPAYPPPPAQYYYPPTPSSDLTPYYYPPTPNYSNCQQSYGYNHPSSYYNPIPAYNPNEQYNYYYNQQTPYPYSQQNSTNDIPLSNNNLPHQSYRRINSNIQRKSNINDTSCI